MIFCWIPIFFYIVVTKHILQSVEHPDEIREVISLGLGDFNTYKIPFNYINNIDKILIVFFGLLFCIGYVFMTKAILQVLFFKKYKKIIVFSKSKYISWLNATLFAIANSFTSILGSICILYWEKLIPSDYRVCTYYLQAVNFIVSWIITYCILNKFMEYFVKCKYKPL